LFRERRDLKAIREILDPQGNREKKATRDQKDPKVQKVRRVLEDFPVLVFRDQQDQKDLPVVMALMVILARWDLRVRLKKALQSRLSWSIKTFGGILMIQAS
jgi:hypothetical protein